MDRRRDSDLWDSPDESFFNSPMTPPANQEPEDSKTHLKRNNVMRNLHKALMILLAASLLPLASTSVNAAAPTVITLTQTGCQFTEPEGEDHGFKTAGADDCKAINARSGKKRLAGSSTITLKPGPYIFRVTNKNVPYQLGFYLRGAGVGRLTLPKVSGGGLVKGKSRDYYITLKAGDYYYSCPLNPTPDYRLKVAN